MNEHIADELIAMARHDLQVREKLLQAGKLSQGYSSEMEQLHLKNAAKLEEIIDLMGYPTRSKVGEEASEAAWLIVQHAISRPALMKRCYVLLSENNDDVDAQNLAYLHDRICYFEGRPQRFGTQFDHRGLYPVEDKAETIRLRKALQMSAHDESVIVECKDMAADLHCGELAFNQWRKSVGWL